MASKAQRAIEGLIARGFSPMHAAVLAGNINVESGFNPEAYNPKEDAFGGIQWRLDRKTGLENYAKETGRKPSDPEAQMDWLVMEMTGKEARNAAEFLAAQDPASANKALKKFIRYAPGTEDARLSHALSYMGQGGGNALMGNGITRVADEGFVHPSFGDAAMPGVPEWNGAGFALPQDGAPAPTLSPPAASAASDDQLFDQFAAPSGGAPASDDDLLNSFLPSAGGAASTAPATAEPTDDDALLNSFLSGGAGQAIPPTGLKPGSKEYADWAVQQAIAGNALPQVSTIPENVAPTGLMDKAGAAAASYMEGFPILGPSWLDAAEQARAAVQGVPVEAVRQETATLREANPVSSTVGGVAGAVLPLLGAGATTAGARLLGVSGTIPQQVAMGALSNAAIAGGDTLARGGDLEQAGKNALLFGGIGGAAPAVLGAAGRVGNALLGRTSPEVAQLAEAARTQFDIPIGPGQISTNPFMRMADDVVNRLPFTGGTVSTEAQQAAFNRAVAHTFGENAASITPDVMANARTRIGNVFESVAARTPTIVSDAAFDNRMLGIVSDAQAVLPGDEFRPLMHQFDQIVDKFTAGQGAITGESYQALTRKGTPLDRLTQSADPNIRHYAGQMREALDDVFMRSAPADALADLQQARAQWKAMKTIEPLAEKAASGDISAPLLMGAARSSYDGLAYGGGGDLAELGRIGQQFLKRPPNSGTPERTAVINMLTKLGPAGGIAALALNPSSIPVAATVAGVGIPAYLAAARGAGAVMRSDALANRLIGNSLGRTANPNAIRAGNLLLRAATGDAAVQQTPMSISVRGGNNSLMAR